MIGMSALLTFLHWQAPSTVNVVLWFVLLQSFIGLLNILYGLTRLGFRKHTSDWVESASITLIRGIGLILFSGIIWIALKTFPITS